MGKVSDNVAPFAAGFSLYYIGVCIFSCYPAFILSITLQRIFYGKYSEADGAYFLGFAAMIVGTFIIVGLIAAKQYFIVLMTYIITAWPFLYILNHWCHASDSEMYPVPLNWWFLW